MSKAAYWQRGEVIDFTNGTEEMIEAGGGCPLPGPTHAGGGGKV